MTQEKKATSAEKITWLASYPKSGNTWVRALLAAYRMNGTVDINQLGAMGMSDAHAQHMRIVSAIDVEKLGVRGQQLLRPAMLLQQIALWPIRPLFVKTHNANVVPVNLGPLIPIDFTQRAIYIVRDPRDVFLSASKFLSKTHDEFIKQFNDDRFCIGMQTSNDIIASQLCGWSTHVKSWTQEQGFPTLVLRYEDIMEDPAGALAGMLEFCGEQDIDEDRVRRSADACALSKLREQEEQRGFAEGSAKSDDQFFYKGGSRWKQELAYKYVKQIQKDHAEMMAEFGYETAAAGGLEAVL